MPTATITRDWTQRYEGENPLPSTIQTPSGIALVEIQGTINVGDRPLTAGSVGDIGNYEEEIPFNPYEQIKLGKFDFSHAEVSGVVVVDVDGHQRLRGKITKLKTPLAVLKLDTLHNKPAASDGQTQAEIPVLEVITHKIVFSTRPEPLINITSK